MSALGLIVHTTIDGAPIAAAALISWRAGLVAAVGIIVHDITDGLQYNSVVDTRRLTGRITFSWRQTQLRPSWAGRLCSLHHVVAPGLRLFSEYRLSLACQQPECDQVAELGYCA